VRQGFGPVCLLRWVACTLFCVISPVCFCPFSVSLYLIISLCPLPHRARALSLSLPPFHPLVRSMLSRFLSPLISDAGFLG
jgi:hypothetical protein